MKPSLFLLFFTSLLLIGCESDSSTGQDPLVQNSIQVSFEITVPAYQSNELRVELVWGKKNLTAMWVGDEFWTASGEFPTSTQHLLTVIFYDENGDIELASVNQEFKTGSNAAEVYKISADQFDTDRWDSDEDGVNNLDELVAGTDPLLDIRDYVVLDYSMSVTNQFDFLVNEERPYIRSYDEYTPSPDNGAYRTTSRTGDINIDAGGNGTLSHYLAERSNAHWLDRWITGTRTNSGNSILWEGEWKNYNGDYTHTINFTNEVTLTNENTREIIESMDGVYYGTYYTYWQTSRKLIGKLIEGSAQCIAVAGTVSANVRTNSHGRGEFVTSTKTISKDEDDQYWRVVEIGYENDEIEYFARELELRGINCDFVDL